MKNIYKTIIIGAGISGLSLANELVWQGHPVDELLVVEADSRVGGLIRTTKTNGYVLEWGPEGLRGNKDTTKRIFSFINSQPYALDSSIPTRYIVHKGKLRKVPHGPISAIFTPLLSFFGKLRLLWEPFVKSKADQEETISEFIGRRFGKRLLPIIEAVVSGVYGGSPEELSVNHTFPFLKQAEKEGGSVILGGFKMYRQMKKMKPKTKERKSKDPFLVKPDGGMQEITDLLAKNINVKLNFKVKSVSKENDLLKIQSENESLLAENLVIATGLNGAQKINIMDIPPLNLVPESMVTIVSMAYDKSNFPFKYEGYGFLSPPKENTFVLGSLFTSQLFPNTAPEDKVVLRCFVGGVRNPDRAIMSDEDLIYNVKKDLLRLMKIDIEPDFASVQGHAPKGISQILLGHDKNIKWRKDVESELKNLYLTGIGWRTISCDGLISEAIETAKKIIK